MTTSHFRKKYTTTLTTRKIGKIIPLADYREMYRLILKDDKVLYFEEPITKEVIKKGEFYSGQVYTQRFLDKHVYETEDYTMVCLDTLVDGNKVLAIFETSKKVTGIDKKLAKAYKKFWPPMQF